MSKSEAQLEKERKQKEHRQKILKQHGGSSASGSKSKSGSSSSKKGPDLLKKSAFQDLFQQRAQGFQIEFKFRNAPPRPPVGPTFVGPAFASLDAALLEESRQYKPLNAVEVNYKWKLHSEADLGVPIAPFAMDLKSYAKDASSPDAPTPRLHPDDEELLEWKGSMGDTAAEEMKVRQQRARVAARKALATGRPTPDRVTFDTSPSKATQQQQQRPASSKKAFSRVLDEGMQTWMKKTTYLSNDYSRKVHDFKSLAQTKQELAQDLQVKQVEIAKRRSADAIAKSFEDLPMDTLQHPVHKKLKPKKVLQVLPDVDNWGRTFTHLVIDKAPGLDIKKAGHLLEGLDSAFVGNVEKREANARMSCELFLPVQEEKKDEDGMETDEAERFEAAQSYDLDVVPLKEEDLPYTQFCFWVNEKTNVATYLPIASRVQLSTGRPARNGGIRLIRRRPLTQQEKDEMEERVAEVDRDLAEKHHVTSFDGKVQSTGQDKGKEDSFISGEGGGAAAKKGDDGEDDFGDDDDSSDSDDEALFGANTKTIVAES